MTSLLLQAGLRYNEETSIPGAQTERRGEAGPVRDLLGGVSSPAAFFTARSFLLCLASGL